jgi:trimethylamine--corrinoid protein Co-methyltransferase
VIVPINTLSPLQVDFNSLEMLMQYVRNGQPTMISPCVMAGTTGPVTLAGTIALANAEALAGIALAQMIRPGVPVVYGFQSTAADLRTGGICIGGPERSLCITYGARLARAYGLPSRGGGADNDAVDLSGQSGYESMMSMLVTRFEKINFVLHSIGMSASFAAVSYEQFIFGLEIMGMIERYKRGIKINPETLALDVIKEAGIGGEFLTKKHTLRHMRKELHVPLISHRVRIGLAYDDQMMKQDIQLKLRRMLAEYQRPDLPIHSLEQMRFYLAERKINTHVVDRLLE